LTLPIERLREALSQSYTIDRELGRGGMATVYLAQDTRHERLVALKVLHPELAASLGPDRFLREIKVAARLNHPHILPLHESGQADGFLYYVMPYVEGESLRERLDREQLLPVDEAIRHHARAIASALDYAHRQQIVHRDIKPENVMLHEGEAMVMDFGIAKAVSSVGSETLTQTGMMVGTPAYVSPEQAAGEANLDGRSDQYSLAACCTRC
jgi:eukaryotic-like serine/threonine-protein kinase